MYVIIFYIHFFIQVDNQNLIKKIGIMLLSWHVNNIITCKHMTFHKKHLHYDAKNESPYFATTQGHHHSSHQQHNNNLNKFGLFL